MKHVLTMLTRIVSREAIRSLFRHHKATLYAVALILIVVVASNKAAAAEYEYKGVYQVQTVLLQYCEDCWLNLPADYLKSEVALSVSTDSEKSLLKALQAASRSAGWVLTRSGKNLTAEPSQNDGNVVYISCMDHQPKNVPKYLYSASIESDRLLCRQRDSLAIIQQGVADSVKRYRDSLANLPKLDYRSYELRYYAYSKSFTDKLGVEWGSVLFSGNLHNRFKVYDDWKIYANEINDTTFNYRSMFFSLDSTLNVDWGSEEQVLSKTFQNDGVVTQEYEWRKYGIIVTIERKRERVKMTYTFRDKDNSISVLQGSVVGSDTDTLFLQGNYMAKREVNSGLPWLSKIPIVNWFVATQHTINDLKEFELYLIPQKQEIRDTLKMHSIEKVEPIYKELKNEKDSIVVTDDLRDNIG